MTELGEVLIIRLAQLRHLGRHGPGKYIVLRYIVKKEAVSEQESGRGEGEKGSCLLGIPPPTLFMQIKPSSPAVLPV
jgi:hypothetical protein